MGHRGTTMTHEGGFGSLSEHLEAQPVIFCAHLGAPLAPCGSFWNRLGIQRHPKLSLEAIQLAVQNLSKTLVLVRFLMFGALWADTEWARDVHGELRSAP